MSDDECLHSHSVAFPRMSVIELTLKDVSLAPLTYLLAFAMCGCLTNPFDKHTKFADECSFSMCMRLKLLRILLHLES